jgi:glycosyltransferase involved in cell wall biosynthesis
MREALERQGDRDAALQELGLDPSLPTLLHVSLMRPVKRPKDLLLAFEQLKTPANLVMVGGGPLFDPSEVLPALPDNPSASGEGVGGLAELRPNFRTRKTPEVIHPDKPGFRSRQPEAR